MNKLCVVGYLPSPSDARFNTRSFLANIKANPPTGDVLFYSDHPQPDWPNVIPLRKNIDTLDQLKHATITRPGASEPSPNRAAFNNAIFLTGLRIAESKGITHMLYVETDVRVRGAGWDQKIFGEFFNSPRHLIAAGSIMAFNVANESIEALKRFYRFVDETAARGRRMPIPPFGWLSAASNKGSVVFTNGAGSVYSIQGLRLLFPPDEEKTDIALAARIPAWDFETGHRLWRKFGVGSYELLDNLPSVFSAYGDVLSTPESRLAMLNDGYSLVHQIKEK